MTRINMLATNRSTTTTTKINKSNPLFSWTAASVVALTLLLLWYMTSPQQHFKQNEDSGVRQQPQHAAVKDLQQGRTETGVDFYHCRDAEEKKHLVLLHGSKFTKENWKTSGILRQFCNTPGLTVSALDLTVQATHQDFIQLLTKSPSLFSEALPIAAVVTPSASGKVITDWMMNGEINTVSQYIQTWIPVAAGSVHSTTEQQLQALRSSGIDVLAIYGDQDKTAGHDTSMLLQKWSGATTVELKGGHPCYLDSPDEFVSVIRSNLGF
jgi:hypothetical protein